MSKHTLSPQQEQALKDIGEKIFEAHKLIRECTEIADEHKVSFYTGAIGGGIGLYLPESEDGVPVLDEEGYEVDSEYGDAGWEHSAVC